MTDLPFIAAVLFEGSTEELQFSWESFVVADGSSAKTQKPRFEFLIRTMEFFHSSC
jgi:hypothetical protein